MIVCVSLCGSLRASIDGTPIEGRLQGPKAALAFAYLVLHRHKTVSRDELIGELWSDADGSPVAPDAALSTILSRLRAAIAPARLEGRSQLRLDLGERAQVDVERAFTVGRLAAAALAEGDPERAAGAAREALAVLDQPFLAGIGSRWVEERRREHEAARVANLETLARAALQIGDGALPDAERAARAAVEADPYRESARALLMQAHAACGNVAEALREYDDLRRFLREELGASPAPEITALNERLLLGEPEPAPAPPAEPARRDGLGAVPRIPAYTTPFTGRQEELAALAGHLGAIEADESRLVVVSGEPGIGKTRLVAKLMDLARDRGMLVLYGGGDDERALPFQPLAEALRAYLYAGVDEIRRSGLDSEIAELARLMPDRRLEPAASMADGDPDLQRFRLFESVTSVFVHAASAEPLVVVLDDLQWADRSTLQMLTHLIRAAEVPGSLIVAVHQESGVAHLLSMLRRHRPIDHISLRGLAAADSERLVRDRRTDLSRAMVDRLVAESGGNPFFLEELLRSLDSPPRDQGQLSIPTTVKALVERRLQVLDDGVVRMLRTAAVVGNDFDLDVARRVVGMELDEALDAMDAALDANLVVEHEHTNTVSFAHSLIRRALYSSQSRSRRARLHLAVGTELERRGAQPAEMARHFWEARHVGGAASAVRHLAEAGSLADAALAWEDAAGHFDRALRADLLTGESRPSRRGELLLALGDAHEHAGHSDAAKTAFLEAAELARASGESDLLALAALGYGRAPGDAFGADELLLRLLEEALPGLGKSSVPLRARVLGRLAVERSGLHGASEEADELACEAVAVAEACDDDLVLAIALASRHWTLSDPERVLERVTVARRSLALAIRAGDRERELAGRAWWLFDLLELGDIAGVEQQLAAYTALAGEFRHPSYDGYAAAMGAMLALLRGQHAIAADEIEHARELLERASDPDAIRIHALQRFVLLHQSGEYPAAARVAAGMSADGTSRRSLWPCLEAWAWSRAGDLERARSSLPEIDVVVENRTWLVSMTALAHVSVDTGDRELAARALERLAPFDERAAAIQGIVCLGPVAYPLGRLAALLGDRARGRRWLREAVVHSEEMDAQPAAEGAAAELADLSYEVVTSNGGAP